MTKIERIELCISGKGMTNILIKKLKFVDITRYAKENNLTWKIDDIGRNQKVTLIESIIKHKEGN